MPLRVEFIDYICVYACFVLYLVFNCWAVLDTNKMIEWFKKNSHSLDLLFARFIPYWHHSCYPVINRIRLFMRNSKQPLPLLGFVSQLRVTSANQSPLQHLTSTFLHLALHVVDVPATSLRSHGHAPAPAWCIDTPATATVQLSLRRPSARCLVSAQQVRSHHRQTAVL